jgi:hypothetical protein
LISVFFVNVNIDQTYTHVFHLEGMLAPITIVFFIEVHIPRQENKRSCICVVEVSILPLSMSFLVDYGIVVTL